MTFKAIVLTVFVIGSPLNAQDERQQGGSYEAGLKGPIDVFKGRPYAPYANRSFPTNVYFGDTHVHTALSPDAGGAGTTLGPRDAYRFARGEQVVTSTGQVNKLRVPYDFFMITDHSDAMGVIQDMLDKSGKPQEKVYDVAVSGGRTIGPDGRCREPVGDTVDLNIPSWKNTIGASELGTVWTDPDFDPELKAFYYARVLEIPTPRWTAYDRVKFNLDLPDEVPLKQQERAYTSPIWYAP